jgi:type IV secretory pathway ATPase VirB11/archaellum biosynthesis ATPase
MEQHVELERQFLEVDEAKDPEAATLESYIASISGADTGAGWGHIFAAKQSVVILGEPGSGKTHEP